MTNTDKSLPLRISDWFGGTTRFYAAVFTTCGIVLAFLGKLTAQYVALVAGIQTLIVTHSIGQDYNERAEKVIANGNGNGHAAGEVETVTKTTVK